MRSKKWKRSKSVLPLLLSAMMVVEPLGTAITVHAEEIAPPVIAEEPEQESVNVEETLPDSEEEVKEDANNETETDDEQEGNSQETDQSSEGETTGEHESSDSENTDQKDESSEETSDTEDQETDENVPSEEEGVSEAELEEETVSGNDMEEEQDSDTEQFTDMPDKYQLTAAQRIDKEVLAGEAGNINEADEGVMYAKGQVMVAANSREEAEMIAEAYNAEIKGFENGVLLLELQEGNTVASAVKAAASTRNRLPAVWPNYYRYLHVEETASANSSDIIKIEETEYEVEDSAITAYAEEEGTPALEAYANAIASYNDPDLLSGSDQYQWQHVAVGSPYAWAEGYTGQGVKVAVLDTGVMGTHTELTLAGEADTTGGSVVTGSGVASDKGGHGTHVAGIIGAKANNKTGGAGIAPNATLYAVNVMVGGEYAATDWAIIQGIEQAIQWNIDIINMSLGGPGYNELCQRTVTKAYNNGIAIFVSAGNDGASCINYPAHYDHIICVAATDQDNSRADFSTYGSWVDLSAPGVAIWSTYYDGNYTIMDGTSMACPVAVGEAAVILSGDDSLKGMAKNGSKVDALENKMKSNTVKASGNGMGSGVTSLTKVFHLSTASVKPQAPTINIEPDDKSKAQKVTVTITAPQSGMTIYYTDNGKNPVYKNGEADANTKLYSKPLEIKNNAKGTIKAIAVNESGVASAVKSSQYTLMPYVSTIKISGVERVAKGKSIQLTAEVLPEYATNKKLEWKLYTKDGAEATAAKDNISISAAGKITAKAGAEENAQYTARATAKDGSGECDEYVITVIAATKMKSAKFDQKSVTLSIPKDKNYDLAQILNAEFADGTSAAVTDFKWSSNNKKIATVDNGVVQPLKAGKITVTALANDSSGKKATCAVTIKQQATGIQILGSSSVAAGKGVTFKATVFPTDVSVKKVTWSIVDNATGQEPAASTGVTINKNSGKLTTKSMSAGHYTVKASAADDSGQIKTMPVDIYDGAIRSIAFDKASDKKITIFRKKVTSATKDSATVKVKIEGTTERANLDAYEVSSSNSGIATATHSRSGNEITLNIEATGRAAGKTNITLAATDGSGKKVTCAVTVNNPVTKVHISSATKTMSARTEDGLVIDMVVIKGKSLQLKATLESEYGAVSNKKVNWSINAPAESGIAISKSGKVSAKKAPNAVYDKYIYTVTAVAADGSGAKATYNVTPAPAATIVSVPDLIPLPGYINRVALKPMPLNQNGDQLFVEFPIVTDVSGGYIEATSSNPNALEVTVYYKKGYRLLMTAHDVTKDTMVTVTVKATDGSGKKASYKVLVVR